MVVPVYRVAQQPADDHATVGAGADEDAGEVAAEDVVARVAAVAVHVEPGSAEVGGPGVVGRVVEGARGQTPQERPRARARVRGWWSVPPCDESSAAGWWSWAAGCWAGTGWSRVQGLARSRARSPGEPWCAPCCCSPRRARTTASRSRVIGAWVGQRSNLAHRIAPPSRTERTVDRCPVPLVQGSRSSSAPVASAPGTRVEDRQSADLVEHSVGRDEWDVEPKGGRRDPPIGLVDLLAERVSGALAAITELGTHAHESIVGLHHDEARQVSLESSPPKVAPALLQGPVPKLGHAGEREDDRSVPRSSPDTARRGRDAGTRGKRQRTPWCRARPRAEAVASPVGQCSDERFPFVVGHRAQRHVLAVGKWPSAKESFVRRQHGETRRRVRGGNSGHRL